MPSSHWNLRHCGFHRFVLCIVLITWTVRTINRLPLEELTGLEPAISGYLPVLSQLSYSSKTDVYPKIDFAFIFLFSFCYASIALLHYETFSPEFQPVTEPTVSKACSLDIMAGSVGIEPTTHRLTVCRSTTELTPQFI